jgi:hypothetical protein
MEKRKNTSCTKKGPGRRHGSGKQAAARKRSALRRARAVTSLQLGAAAVRCDTAADASIHNPKD